MKQNGIKISHSSVRHPASNPSERVMRELGRLFRTFSHKSHSGWAMYLPQIEVLFNSTPHLTTGFTPFEILYGKNEENAFTKFFAKYLPPSTELSLEEIRNIVSRRLQKVADLRIAKLSGCDRFVVGDLVLLREHPLSDASMKISSKLCPLYSGPYLIIDNKYPNVYLLANPDNPNIIKGNYNITNLKLYYRPIV